MGKRKKTEGSVGRHKGGSVHVRVYVPVKLRHLYNGQRRVSVYGKTEEEAFAKRDALRRDMDRRRTRSGSQTFASYLSGWLENLGALDLVSERTLEDYRYFATRHLIPNVGPVVLEELTAEDLDDLYVRLRKENVGVRTVNHVHSTARAALQRAVRKRLIPHNPARDADPPQYSTVGREYATLSQDDVTAFFGATAKLGDRFEALFVLSVLTGMRPAEARALRWRDVDANRGEAVVRRSVVELRGEPPKIRDWTKTRKKRVVPLLPPVLLALNSHKTRQNEEKLALRGLWEDDTIVFPTSKGGVMAGRNLSRRHLKPVLKEAGLSEKTRPYDLRHHFATI
jgi:integrase